MRKFSAFRIFKCISRNFSTIPPKITPDPPPTKELSTTPDPSGVTFQAESSELIDDYTESPTKITFSQDSEGGSEFFPYLSESGYAINTPSELQLKGNPLALEILTEGKIDLRNKKVVLENAGIQEMEHYSLEELKEMNDKIAQINVGNIDVLPKNSILLEDLDVYNIPEDKDIVIEKTTKKMVVMGHKVPKSNALASKQSNDGTFEVSKNIFEELSFDEFKKKYLFDFESKNVRFQKKLLLRDLLRLWPIFVVFGCFTDTILELYFAKSDNNLIEEQEMDIFNRVREKYMKEVLLGNEIYDRSLKIK